MPDQDSPSEKIELSPGARRLRPISKRVLGFLRWCDSPDTYFGQGVSEAADEEEKVNTVNMYFYASFFDRLKSYSALSFIVFGTLVIIDFVTIHDFPHQAYGLAFDCIGAIILALGLFRGQREILRDSKSGDGFKGPGGYNPEQLSATTRNTVDGFLGGMFLVGGFMIQLPAML